MGGGRKARGNDKERVKRGPRGEGKGEKSKCCRRQPEIGEIDRKAKWMATKRDQKGKRQEKRRMKAEHRRGKLD